jgi:hypothetical protein
MLTKSNLMLGVVDIFYPNILIKSPPEIGKFIDIKLTIHYVCTYYNGCNIYVLIKMVVYQRQ